MRYDRLGVLDCVEDRTCPGYTLVPTFRGRTVRLIDVHGAEVHRWTLPGRLGSLAYLLPGGRLLCSTVTDDGPPLRQAKGGHLHELDWDGAAVWDYVDHGQHHDLRRLDNGNTLYLGWRAMSEADAARVRGGIAGMEKDGKIYEDYLREVSPAGETVWEWAASELEIERYPLADGVARFEFAHANTCAPLPDGRILLNFRNADLMAILDRSTRRFVWEKRDFIWGRPHDPHLLDSGEILFFANGAHDLVPPARSAIVQFDRETGAETWRYEAPQAWTFYSHVMGGVERLPNGNTLIVESVNGRIFEVTPEGALVWDYVNPDFDAPFPTSREPGNAVFRAFRYPPGAAELGGRL